MCIFYRQVCFPFLESLKVSFLCQNLFTLLPGRHDQKEISLHVALPGIMNWMDSARLRQNHVLISYSLAPIPVFCGELNRVSGRILVQLLTAEPNLLLDAIGVRISLRNRADSDGVIKGYLACLVVLKRRSQRRVRAEGIVVTFLDGVVLEGFLQD